MLPMGDEPIKLTKPGMLFEEKGCVAWELY